MYQTLWEMGTKCIRHALTVVAWQISLVYYPKCFLIIPRFVENMLWDEGNMYIQTC